MHCVVPPPVRGGQRLPGGLQGLHLGRGSEAALDPAAVVQLHLQRLHLQGTGGAAAVSTPCCMSCLREQEMHVCLVCCPAVGHASSSMCDGSDTTCCVRVLPEPVLAYPATGAGRQQQVDNIGVDWLRWVFFWLDRPAPALGGRNIWLRHLYLQLLEVVLLCDLHAQLAALPLAPIVLRRARRRSQAAGSQKDD